MFSSTSWRAASEIILSGQRRIRDQANERAFEPRMFDLDFAGDVHGDVIGSGTASVSAFFFRIATLVEIGD